MNAHTPIDLGYARYGPEFKATYPWISAACFFRLSSSDGAAEVAIGSAIVPVEEMLDSPYSSRCKYWI